MSFEIVEVNGLATFQGAPVWGRRHFGVPEGGAWDRTALRAANSVLGNDQDAVAIELSLARLVLKAKRSVSVATAGAPARVQVANAERSDGEPVLVEEGQICEIGVPSAGARVYVAVPGGVEPHLRGKRAERGMNFEGGSGAESVIRKPGNYRFAPLDSFEIIPFGDEPLPEELTNSAFTVGFQSNRVGLRLSGPCLALRPEGASEPACHGTLQLDNSGAIIILGPDGPTLGGYPKLAVVASHHLDDLGQLRPGDPIRFSTKARA